MPVDRPDGFTETVKVPGVKVLEAAVVIHDTLLLAAQVVFAPPALTLIVWGAGVEPDAASKTRLLGVMASSATWFWTAAHYNGRFPKSATVPLRGGSLVWLKGVIGKDRRRHLQRLCCSLYVRRLLNMFLSLLVSICYRKYSMMREGSQAARL